MIKRLPIIITIIIIFTSNIFVMVLQWTSCIEHDVEGRTVEYDDYLELSEMYRDLFPIIEPSELSDYEYEYQNLVKLARTKYDNSFPYGKFYEFNNNSHGFECFLSLLRVPDLRWNRGRRQPYIKRGAINSCSSFYSFDEGCYNRSVPEDPPEELPFSEVQPLLKTLEEETLDVVANII